MEGLFCKLQMLYRDSVVFPTACHAACWLNKKWKLPGTSESCFAIPSGEGGQVCLRREMECIHLLPAVRLANKRNKPASGHIFLTLMLSQSLSCYVTACRKDSL